MQRNEMEMYFPSGWLSCENGRCWKVKIWNPFRDVKSRTMIDKKYFMEIKFPFKFDNRKTFLSASARCNECEMITCKYLSKTSWQFMKLIYVFIHSNPFESLTSSFMIMLVQSSLFFNRFMFSFRFATVFIHAENKFCSLLCRWSFSCEISRSCLSWRFGFRTVAIERRVMLMASSMIWLLRITCKEKFKHPLWQNFSSPVNMSGEIHKLRLCFSEFVSRERGFVIGKVLALPKRF